MQHLIVSATFVAFAAKRLITCVSDSRTARTSQNDNTTSSMYLDSRSLQVTASHASSVKLLDDAVLAYLGMKKDAGLRVAALLQADEECVLAHCLNGYLAMHACRREQTSRARETVARAKSIAEMDGANRREELHIAALDNWSTGKIEAAVDCLENILADFPLDILALRLSQFLTSYLGRSKAIRDSIAPVLPAWSPEIPGYGFVLSCYAYGLEEAGDYDAAERFGRQAVELNPNDLWGAHAVAHVMEMQGRPAEGVEWITKTEQQWDGCGNFINHLWWHCGLYHLATANYAEALELYDRKVNVRSDEYLDFVNASALLWRIEQAGVDVENRWEGLATQVEAKLEDHCFVFVDLHYLLATATIVDAVRIQEALDACIHYASGDSTEAFVMRDVGLAMAKAILAHRRQSYGDASDLLFPVRHEIHRVGGSHAQRDVFEQLLIDSAIRAERFSLAKSLVQERIKKRPRDIWSWRNSARIAEKLADLEGVAASHAEVERILGYAKG
jgi:tetratricopeptide (TPR) repeat protein